MSAMAARIVLATKLFVGVFGEILWSGSALAVGRRFLVSRLTREYVPCIGRWVLCVF